MDEKIFEMQKTLTSCITELINAQNKRLQEETRTRYLLISLIFIMMLIYFGMHMYEVSKQYDYNSYPTSTINNSNNNTNNK